MRRGIIAASGGVVYPPQTTSTNGGRAYFIKRGSAGVNSDFPVGPFAVIARVRISDWIVDSGTNFCNLMVGNIAAGDNGANQSGGLQFGYMIPTGEIVTWVGEAWSGGINVIRGGSYSGWMTLAWHGSGNTSEQAKMSWSFDDEGTVNTVNVGLGGNLRQVVFGGAQIVFDERSNNLRLGPLIVLAQDVTQAEILQQRTKWWPQVQGPNLTFYNSFASGSGCEQDQSDQFGGLGTHDFQAFDEGQQSQVSDVPSIWT